MLLSGLWLWLWLGLGLWLGLALGLWLGLALALWLGLGLGLALALALSLALGLPGHVQVVEEDAVALAPWRAVDPLPPLLETAFQQCLGLIG